MTKIRALLFDANGTLIDIETDEWMEEAYRAISHFLTYQGIRMRRYEVRDLYFRIMKEQFAASTEKYPEFDVVAVWREFLRRQATDYTRSVNQKKLQQMPFFLAEMQRGISRKRLVAFPQTQEILAQLKTQYSLAIVSDAQTAYAVPELHRAGLAEFFDPIVISGDYGYRKPDPRLFRTALEKLAAGPEEAVFIGNDPFRDISGARQVGMKTILFCPNGSPACPPESAPDYLLYQYADLPRAIQFLSGE
jgi:putative hydrolase of the HAD superfamily